MFNYEEFLTRFHMDQTPVHVHSVQSMDKGSLVIYTRTARGLNGAEYAEDRVAFLTQHPNGRSLSWSNIAA